MGDEISSDKGAITLQAKFPSRAEINLFRDGKCVKALQGETFTYITNEPGVYRVEAHKGYLGKRRGWIFSNPIYIQ